MDSPTAYASTDDLIELQARQKIEEIRARAQQLMLKEIQAGRLKSVPPQPGMSRKDRRRLATMIRKSPRTMES